MAKKQRKYDMEYKVQAVKLAKELGGAKAAAELGMQWSSIFVTLMAKKSVFIFMKQSVPDNVPYPPFDRHIERVV